MMTAFLASIKSELWRVSKSPWDILMTVFAPLLIIGLFGAIFWSGKPAHLPIGVIDDDQSPLSAAIIHHISQNHSLDPIRQPSLQSAKQATDRLDIGGFIYIPKGAQHRLTQGTDTGIYVAYNQSFYSTGNSIGTAAAASVRQASIHHLLHEQARTNLPYAHLRMPSVHLSVLFNPTMSYELFLEPFVIMASLHLLLCCLVAYSIGELIKDKKPTLATVLGGVAVYVLVIGLWTMLWAGFMGLRGWTVAGNAWALVAGGLLLYTAYGFLAASVVLLTKSATKSFGILAVYGGSSLSFAGISLPLNNASAFTQTWSALLPYTHFARLQTEQWVIGSPLWVSLPHLGVLLAFNGVFFGVLLFALRPKHPQSPTQHKQGMA